MALTDRVVANLKPTGKRYRKGDGNGLFVIVGPTGFKSWWYQYRFGGKQKTLTIGPYPTISLVEARERARAAKTNLIDGIDPSAEKKRKAHNLATEDGSLFKELAEAWFEKRKANFSEGHAANVKSRIDRIVVPAIGNLRVKEVTTQHLYDLLRPIEARGAYETAHRVYQVIGNVLRYAVKLGLCDRDVTADMKGMLEPRKEKHHPSVTKPIEVGRLLKAIYGFEGYFVVSCALKLSALTFVRPGELRGAEWTEFDLNNSEWRIPPERMKGKKLHIVPLSRQAKEIILTLREATGHCQYLFPSVRTTERTISENTVNNALRQMGYTKEEMVAHGFRSMASTLLNQMRWNRDWIERQLAHEESNSVRAAYNFTDFLEERTVMMQAWADYLDRLRANTSDILPEPIRPRDVDL